MRKASRRSLAPVLGLVGLVIVGLSMISYHVLRQSEHFLRNQVVLLTGNKYQCSGEQIQAPSGERYILTAAHCRVLAKDGYVMASTEGSPAIPRRVIHESPTADLLLIEAMPGLPGIKIAPDVDYGDRLRAFTHGAGMKTYLSEGRLVDERKVSIPLDIIVDDAQLAACQQPKNAVEDVQIWLFTVRMCVLKVTLHVTTLANIVGGSSGGPVFDDAGHLVGVVSATGNGFSLIVRLEDIQEFLQGF